METLIAQLINVNKELNKSKPNSVIGGKCHYTAHCACQRFIPVCSGSLTCDGCHHHLSYHTIHDPCNIQININNK